ncbi:unnamed protein product, partial [Didymodactylos carnosus]
VKSTVVRSMEITQSEISEISTNGTPIIKKQYSMCRKKFDSIADLVSYYRTYDFAENKTPSHQLLHRLGQPLPRPTWRIELEQQLWYQPNVSREQAEELLNSHAELMSFLIRESSNRTHQGYTISVYVDNSTRHSPIYGDSDCLMCMSVTFTSLIELVAYYKKRPIFGHLCLTNPAPNYSQYQQQLKNNLLNGKINAAKNLALENDMKINKNILRFMSERTNDNDEKVYIEIILYVDDENDRTSIIEDTNDIGLTLRFENKIESESFKSKITSPVKEQRLNTMQRL